MAGKVLLAMSGGVDSTVAAILLLEMGYEVTGMTFTVNAGSKAPTCAQSSGASAEEASLVSKTLGIPHHRADLTTVFRKRVLEAFKRSYLAGTTPNPCIACNCAIKFRALPEWAASNGIGFDLVATGHYAGVRRNPSWEIELVRGKDLRKDQSYFLAMLTRDQLSRAILPLAEMTKDRVVEIAMSHGFRSTAERPESQDFAGRGGLASILGPEGLEPGPILSLDGKRLGSHGGWALFTRGQRHGLDVGGQAEPLYVIGTDPPKASVTVGRREDLLSEGLAAGPMNWLAPETPPPVFEAEARIRSAGRLFPVTVRRMDPEGREVEVLFSTPQFAVTPGQYLVLYRGDVVLGAGQIMDW